MAALISGSRLALLGTVTIAAVLATVLLPALPQPLEYHAFADRRAFAGIPNALNVLSNFAFLLVGGSGLVLTLRRHANSMRQKAERWSYALFFVGVALTSLGSAYYHWAPDNERLLWDRLPMALAFMSLVAAQVAERIEERAGWLTLVLLVPLGVASVVYWRITEDLGQGNVMPYVVVQAYAAAGVLSIAACYPPRYTHGRLLLGTLGWYALAKVCELFDTAIFAFGQLVSGHTLKHLAAAMASYWLYRMLRERQPLR